MKARAPAPAKRGRRSSVGPRSSAGLVVPPIDAKPWPTLGPQLCDWIEDNLVFGPGDLRGEPAVVDAETRGLIYRAYEVYPQRHAEAGRRRFKRVCWSLRKGSAKTEKAAWLAAAELDPTAPVRCIGWDRRGHPIGGPVTDPYIPLVAYTEEQSEELCYGALRVILEASEVAHHFDIGLERIMRIDGDGKAVALAAAPGPRDGARTTFQVFDETHRFTLPKLRRAHETMLANVPKRYLADAWSLETTTAFQPGERSVAEDTNDYARAIAEGRVTDARLFYFHRQAREDHDLETKKGLLAAIHEASGPVHWSDVSAIVDSFRSPRSDKALLRRLWLNQPVAGGERAFDATRWAELARPGYQPKPGARITLGFDGARRFDATALVGTEIETGFQFVLGAWEAPYGPAADTWEVPEEDVQAAVGQAMERFDVWRLYADPPYWDNLVAAWAGEFGKERVIPWPTARVAKMAAAVRAFVEALEERLLSHDGADVYARHLGNAFKRPTRIMDDQGGFLWTIRKERRDSPHKIDVGMAGILSWEARRDAIASGVGKQEGSVYDQRGVLVV